MLNNINNMIEDISLKEIQRIIDNWIHTHGGYWPPLSMISAIMEELGELAREINSLEGYKPKKNFKLGDIKIGEELADLLFSIICVANHYKIDLSDELGKIIKKYSERNSKRFV
jgi:NTP pyrophosphatase (non-canonical NTP hydrolase)